MAHHQYLYLNDLKAKFEQNCAEDASLILPCSESDISALEQQFNIRLPRAYREFLLWMGRGGGLFLQKQYRYDVLPLINSEAHGIVARKRPDLTLPSKAFVIGIEISESFYFLRCDEGDNPNVYIFMDKEEQDYIQGEWTITDFPRQWAFLFDNPRNDFGVFSPSFTDYLDYHLGMYIRLKQQAKAREQERLKRQ